ncbi:copper resistance CopC family protein [Micromonospora sp. NPDC003776]
MRRDLRLRAGRLGRHTARLAAVVMVILAALPGVASADSSLVSAEPASGAVLAALPDKVTLRFAGKVWGDDSHVAVFDAGGGELADGDVQQPGPEQLQLPIRLTAPGDFTIAYHVIFLDGSSATGVYRFSAGTGAAPAPLPAVAAQQTMIASVTGHQHQVDAASAVLLVIDGAVLVVVLFLMWVRPRHKRPGAARAWRYREGNSP